MHYDHTLNISHNDIACLAAGILLEDHAVNAWGFDGFPAINIDHDKDQFSIELALDKHSSGSAVISRHDAASQVKRVREGRPVSPSVRKSIIGLVQALESSVRF